MSTEAEEIEALARELCLAAGQDPERRVSGMSIAITTPAGTVYGTDFDPWALWRCYAPMAEQLFRRQGARAGVRIAS